MRLVSTILWPEKLNQHLFLGEILPLMGWTLGVLTGVLGCQLYFDHALSVSWRELSVPVLISLYFLSLTSVLYVFFRGKNAAVTALALSLLGAHFGLFLCGLSRSFTVTVLFLLASLPLAGQLFYRLAKDKKSLLRWLGGIFVGLTLFLLSGSPKPYLPPWQSFFVQFGVGYIDSFRDMAIIQNFFDYGKITHGLHGTLFTPYHGLFAIFHGPLLFFLPVSLAVQHFSFLVFIPVFFMSWAGILKFSLPVHGRVFFVVATLFSIKVTTHMDYQVLQKSLQISTLLLVPLLPVLYFFCRSFGKERGLGWALCLGVPATIFGRAFAGPLLAVPYCTTLLLSFFRFPKWGASVQLMTTLLLSAIAIFFVSDPVRNHGLNTLQWSPLLKMVQPFLVLNLSIHFLCFLYLNIIQKKSFIKVAKMLLPSFTIGILAFLGALILATKSLHDTDTFYISEPLKLILLFTCAFLFLSCPPRSSEAHHGPQAPLKFLSHRWWAPSFCHFVFLLFAITFLPEKMEHLKTGLRKDIKNAYAYSGQKMPKRKKEAFVTWAKKAITNLKSVPSKKTFPSTGLKNILKAKTSLTGPTFLWIPKGNPYWSPPHPIKKAKLALFPVATLGTPLIYGGNVANGGYSLDYIIQRGGGTIPLTHENHWGILCQKLQELGGKNLIILNQDFSTKTLAGCQYSPEN